MEIRDQKVWGGRPCTEIQAQTILNEVLDQGINFIDTSNDYGRSEEYIGKSIAHRRSEYYLATKCGCPPIDPEIGIATWPKTTHIWTEENLFRGLHESLQRMKTDYVDVIQLHNPTVQECKEGHLVEALQKMKAQGKTRWIGISTALPHLPTYLEWGVFDTFQIPYSALYRDHEDWISKAAKAGLGIIIRGGVARGEPGMGLGSQEAWEMYDRASLDELKMEDDSRTSFLLRFTLSHPHCHTIIVGTMNPDHLKENVRAVRKGPLSEETYHAVKNRLDADEESPGF